ncbi:MAG: prephenate dehydrogenase/arogenate dehydrogenase family protein [Clostridia bacterium]|nr:prephenate dehydrogenase/arogenate dehydrogenase family protein [Clostridia bacterium]
MNIFITGLGLIGGSLAKAISTRTTHHIAATDINKATIECALDCGAIHKIGEKDDLANADIVIVALYPSATVDFIKENLDNFKKDAIIVDTCGVKNEVFDGLSAALKDKSIRFVGGHPMAGIERSGFEHSFASLFDGASMILCPEICPDKKAVQLLSELFTDIGFGKITISTSEHHDKVIAFTSQLAHIVSSAYVHGEYATEHKGFSAGSFKDMTRVARLNADMWTELFFENRENLASVCGELIDNLAKFKAALDGGDRETMHKLLAEGNRRKIKSENI